MAIPFNYMGFILPADSYSETINPAKLRPNEYTALLKASNWPNRKPRAGSCAGYRPWQWRQRGIIHGLPTGAGVQVAGTLGS